MKRYIALVFIGGTISFVLVAFVFFLSNQTTATSAHIAFKSKEGQFFFTAIPAKGRDLQMMRRAFTEYKSRVGVDDDMKVYRVTRQNYLNIHMWCAYKMLPEWNWPRK